MESNNFQFSIFNFQTLRENLGVVFAKINLPRISFSVKNPMAGFTLVELLVVMTIIAILAAVGLGNYTRSLGRGRDARRRSDLKSIQNALEQYYLAKNNKYPGDDTTGDLQRNDPDLIGFFSEGQFPQTVDNKDYCNGDTDTQSPGEVTTTSYWCCEKLEQVKGNADFAGGLPGSGKVPTPASSGSYFCIYNLQ